MSKNTSGTNEVQRKTEIARCLDAVIEVDMFLQNKIYFHLVFIIESSNMPYPFVFLENTFISPSIIQS